MKHSPFRTVDDAGKPVRVFGESTFDSWRTTGDPRLKDLMRRLTFVMAERRFRLNEPEALLMATPAFAVVVSLIMHNVWPSIPALVLILPCALLTFPALRYGMQLTVARRSQAIARLMLDEGLCPVCGYNFFGLELKGPMIRCPECGGEWRTDRIARVLPIDETSRESAIVKAIRQPIELVTVGYDDARGTRVGMVDPLLRAARREASEPARVERLGAARRDLSRIGRGRRLLVVGFIIAVSAVLAGAMVWSRLRGTPPVPLPAFVGPICLTGIGFGVYFGRFGYARRRVRDVMLAHSLCASCAAPLDYLTPDPADGCVTCETCRAAWRLTPPAEAP
jgi:hypothetical protein